MSAKELNIGDYVRTKWGIAKIIGISCGEDLWFDNDNIFDEDEKEIFRYNKPSMYSNWADNNIIKSSTNIIDLIEVGDYVNGIKVNNVDNSILIFYDSDGDWYITNSKDIKSIVTKEQFESMEYKIGE